MTSYRASRKFEGYFEQAPEIMAARKIGFGFSNLRLVQINQLGYVGYITINCVCGNSATELFTSYNNGSLKENALQAARKISGAFTKEHLIADGYSVENATRMSEAYKEEYEKNYRNVA